MTNYKKGRRNEYRTMRLLETSGYNTIRSAGSHSPFDVVGVNESGIVLVQCKTNEWPAPAEMEVLQSYPTPANAKKLVHRWEDRASLPIVKEV